MEYIKHSKITKYEVDLQRINVCISIYPKEGYFTVTVFRVLSVENEVLIFPFFGPYQEVRTGRVEVPVPHASWTYPSRRFPRLKANLWVQAIQS